MKHKYGIISFFFIIPKLFGTRCNLYFCGSYLPAKAGTLKAETIVSELRGNADKAVDDVVVSYHFSFLDSSTRKLVPFI